MPQVNEISWSYLFSGLVISKIMVLSLLFFCLSVSTTRTSANFTSLYFCI